MSVVIERLQDEPTPSGLFRWTEGGLPASETAPGTRGIHVEERPADGTFVPLARLPGVDPDENLGTSVSDGVLTVRVHHGEKTTENARFTAYRYGAIVQAPLPAGPGTTRLRSTRAAS
ncbi:Hsp20/alpha crystallin family protein [Streptomyces scabiei]|uniref:Hsp20/alpha crystallin family protein n=1 Tax=Streptomyces scabiei TaxID=1930 RepID=UPI0029903107|nr:Hsp20/alpha crystallin family protein [Streptomyces scabiei]MDW8803781.1 Hsp20/alpha crystallin family protein [Streptomyces scabiei]